MKIRRERGVHNVTQIYAAGCVLGFHGGYPEIRDRLIFAGCRPANLYEFDAAHIERQIARPLSKDDVSFGERTQERVIDSPRSMY